MFEGQGMYVFNDGSLYMGSYSLDQKHGMGVVVDQKKNSMIKVEMQRDNPISKKPI